MGTFSITITASGADGCERRARAGEKLFGRCGRFTCPDCMVYELVQRMRQAGMFGHSDQDRAEFVHRPGSENPVIDDLLRNERKSGQF